MKKYYYVYDNDNKEILSDFGGCYLYKTETEAKKFIKKLFQCENVESCIKNHNITIKATEQQIF